MSQARCTLHVKGLDCPKEVDLLTAALSGEAGVIRLGFDLIHGTMTLDYDDEVVNPEAVIRRIADRTGLQSTLEGNVERTVPSWWSRHGRWVVTLGSGLALAVGVAFSWMGPVLGWNKPAFFAWRGGPMRWPWSSVESGSFPGPATWPG